REFFRVGIEATNEWTKKTYGKEFDRLTPDQREEALRAMEEGKPEFAGFSSAMFFDALLTMTMEGFFADPMYGGNKNKVAWKMIGFPGLPATATRSRPITTRDTTRNRNRLRTSPRGRRW